METKEPPIITFIIVALGSYTLGVITGSTLNINIFGQGQKEIPGTTQTIIITTWSPASKEQQSSREIEFNESFTFGSWELQVSNIWIGKYIP